MPSNSSTMPSPTRPFLLSHPASQTRLSFPINADPNSLSIAEESADKFHQWLHAKDFPLLSIQPSTLDQVESPDPAKQSDSDFILLAYYLQFAASRPQDAPISAAALLHLHRTLLKNGHLDIHSAALANTSSEDARTLLIRAYFLARNALPLQADIPPPTVGKLWRPDEQAKIVGVFGGQGVNETYWQELVNLYSLYPSLLLPYLEAVDGHLASHARSDEAQASSLYKDYGIQVLNWLNDPASKPPVSYLATCAISLPLIGLVQIAHYVTLGRAQGLSPNHLSSRLAGGLTGHSQGVVVAALVAGRLPSDNDSWDLFYANARHALTVLFHIGLRGSVAFPQTSLPPKLASITAEHEGIPTPMLAVTGLPLEPLQRCIDQLSSHLSASHPQSSHDAQVSLFNGPKAFVVTGHPRTLVGLVSALRKNKAEPGQDQSKIPFSKRLPVFSMRFLPVGVPYHSHHLQGCTDLMLRPAIEGGLGGPEQAWWEAHKATLGCPVFNTETGADLRTEQKGMLESLGDQIFTSPIMWTRACAFPSDTTHTVDFGLGGLSGIGSLVARNIEGKGNRMVFVGLPSSGQGGPKIMNEVYDCSKLIKEEKWSEKFKVRLVKTKNGRIQIDTPFSRLLCKPPLMVAGMTPCTVPTDFNAAVMNAGYHIELAGGGHYNAKALRDKVDAIRAKLERPGLGFTLNALYINQRQWAFQFPLWLEMRKEGLPVEGFVVAAGIPSTERAKEIIDGLREAGIKHVSFKPGSVDGIRQVVQIAAANADFPVVCQWTGGRAGGHHSCEDFHQPILATYGSIRSQSNLLLVAGSGFGSAEDVYPYLTGAWSEERFGVERMPFDGVLFGSRMMVAKEAQTSLAVKKLIVEAPGVDDEQWEGTYDKEAGGILTVTSELGEPIHKIATRGVKLWKEFDQTVFALPREKRAAWLEANRSYVIKRLNADFQKPWFAAKDGEPAELGEMTYKETVERLVRLMFIGHQGRWVDRSLRNLVGDWLRRIEERLSPVNGSAKDSFLQSYSTLDSPYPVLDQFFERYPETSTQILASEDVAYFLAICQRQGQKPVPFIPVLDENFGIWFKKDSLWQAEDIDGVFDQDAQRVAILQGPVAVRHSVTVDESAASILGGIERGVIARVLEEVYGGDETKVPFEEYLAPRKVMAQQDEESVGYVIREEGQGKKVYRYDIGRTIPDGANWLTHLGQSGAPSWLSALVGAQSVVGGGGKEVVENGMRRVLGNVRCGVRVEVVVGCDGKPEKVRVFGGVRNGGPGVVGGLGVGGGSGVGGEAVVAVN